ncbi:PLP-dependent aminotransferase family protein [Winogradskyella bathintestinalis]|uniref:PLP-dependent transferase n=1 Tax=Winogradskyella bathintestinalis TaxID=3035208 RepID=A0ABT7ZUP2_9FLAO|nr:PLP-dependent transferase [Winogradskyella bathintestinalis]MDN3492689.1 PLP-dependent transferase [Winogradskyella bathintestinalis]
MQDSTMLNYLKSVLINMPSDWLNLTTHRLDIYNEKLAKTQFLDQFENLYTNNISELSALNALPTAYDYIRLGHPLSSVLEWTIGKLNKLNAENVISFSSQTIPVLAILRKNLMEGKNTQILYKGNLPKSFDAELIKHVYGYDFRLIKTDDVDAILKFDGSTVFISQQDQFGTINQNANIDFHINLYENLGSILIVNGTQNDNYISDIQHVRRRETIAMTPSNSLVALQSIANQSTINNPQNNLEANKTSVLNSIKNITGTSAKPLVGSSGLSIQYAIMMGLIDDAMQNHCGKTIKFIVPTNCYGGTNDQARRVAACLEHVEVVDLEVDGDNDMVTSLETVLSKIAKEDAVPYIIAEIPTNPRVEVPDLQQLNAVLSQERKTASNNIAIDPVFILDQTFCPNIQFLAEGEILSTVRAISYASGSKFPSGGKCTAGYCVANKKAESLMPKIELHLELCDNEATELQYEILAKQMPSMNQRIAEAYKNTREFVNFIQETLPEAKINFVSEELAERGFTPSVFSLDLPTKGNTAEEKETFKRALNHKLIDLMITKIPNDSKYCVSYGQLKGCYWTIPATSTQGTTKESDKDYIARVALSPNLDLELHKKVFQDFVASI